MLLWWFSHIGGGRGVVAEGGEEGGAWLADQERSGICLVVEDVGE